MITKDRKKACEVAVLTMRSQADWYYKIARSINFHYWVEIAGFMNEIIKICDRAVKNDKDFFVEPLAAHGYEGDYIGEKFMCIFGDLMENNPEFKKGVAKSLGLKV